MADLGLLLTVAFFVLLFGGVTTISVIFVYTIVRAPQERAKQAARDLEEWRALANRLGMTLVPPLRHDTGPLDVLRRAKDENVRRRAAGLPDETDPTRLMAQQMLWADETRPGAEAKFGERTLRLSHAATASRGPPSYLASMVVLEKGLVLSGVARAAPFGSKTKVPTGDAELDARASLVSAEPALAARVAPHARGLLARLAEHGLEFSLAAERLFVALPSKLAEDRAFVDGLGRDMAALVDAVAALPDPPPVVPGPPRPTTGLALWAPRIVDPRGALDKRRLVVAIAPALWPVLGVAFLDWELLDVAFALWGTLAGYYVVFLAASLLRARDMGAGWILHLLFAVLIGAFLAGLVAQTRAGWATLASVRDFLLPAGLGFATALVPRDVGSRLAGRRGRTLFEHGYIGVSGYLLIFFLAFLFAGGAAWVIWLLSVLAQLAIAAGVVRPEEATVVE